ncbi:lysophospholipid acyltransferase family protein [Acinetobacter sp. HY1485]|uniref:lysophospholipid acyltransferase family protein n=1 Tax=Acinetobacter sp. HY1485 TaxID=2970918 RepID=UPI0022B95E8C|nr:lysophospholipid acyltransferase family protein [Acinetobacter sp. HY1485]
MTLKKKLNYAWRVGATGFSFVSFGLGGIAIGTLLAPLVKLKTQDKKQCTEITQRVIQQSFHGFAEMMVKLGIMTYEVEGLEKLKSSEQELVIANHPTLIDVVLLIGSMNKANCVVKQALWKNPFTRGPVQNANYILNAGSEQFMYDCVARLHENGAPSLVIFPEGTRTEKNHHLNDFQRGAANIALRANVPIRPVKITCTPSTLTKNEKWYHIPDQPFHISIQVLDPIYVKDIIPDLSVTPKNVRLLNQYLYQFFDHELSK